MYSGVQNGTFPHTAEPTPLRFDTDRLKAGLARLPSVTVRGRIVEVVGPRILAEVSGVAIGDTVSIELSGEAALDEPKGRKQLLGRVVGFSHDCAVLSPFGSTNGLSPGAEVRTAEASFRIPLGAHLLGCVIDSMGQVLQTPSDEICRLRPALPTSVSGHYSVDNIPPPPLSRKPVIKPFLTGIRAIDSLLTLGSGQRICLLAEPGVGKSTLIGQIARTSRADINVIGLIGERGREVTEFINDTLAPEARARTVVVVSTSDEPAICRVTAASAATRVAEYFRDLGLEVLLQIDSLTRLFRAYREVGLAAGELPVRRGYPPSVFAELPRLIERAGTSERGAITALYTVLLSSDLDEDPMVDEIKGLTDGHIVLRRQLAERGHFPAIDILSSLSRIAARLQDSQHQLAAKAFRRYLSRLEHDRELVMMGGAADDELARAIALEPNLLRYLQQNLDEPIEHQRLTEIAAELARVF